jgi:hypothetical protein
MKKLQLPLSLLIAALVLPFFTSAQQITIFPSNTRSRATSQFYQEEYQRIGNYQVKGNSYFLKGANISDIFTTLGYGTNVPIVFDAYTQQPSILLENKKDMVKLSFEELDSFLLKVDNEKEKVFTEPALFINASKIEKGFKMYLQRLTNEAGYNLYKSYKAEMKPAALDIAQTNLMQFEMASEYFYLDTAASGKKSFVKIKSNAESLKKKFSDKTDAVEILKNLNKENTERLLVTFFEKINK